MAEQAITMPELTRVEPVVQVPLEVERRSWVLLASIVGLACCSLELEVLEQIDSLTLYMTFREVLWDVGVALLVLLGMAVLCWLCLLSLMRLGELMHWTSRHAAATLWRIGITIPLSYFVVDSLKASRLRLYPEWHWGLQVWLWLGPLLVLLCAFLVWRVELSQLQKFCQTRLAPIGWLHVVLALVVLVGLWARGVHVFRNFAHPAQAVLAANKPDIYLITIDTLRADEMSLYGYHRPTTPNLEHFAQQAFTFDFFFANSNFTTPTTTSMETGKLPWTHRIFQLGGFLRGHAQQESLATLLHQYGYYTAQISSNLVATPLQHRTLDSYDAVEYLVPRDVFAESGRYTNLVGLNTSYTLNGMLKSLYSTQLYLEDLMWNDHYSSPAELAFERARRIIEHTEKGQPRFLWTHILPPHDPYLAPAPYRGRFLESTKLTRNYEFVGLENRSLPPQVSVDELRARYDEDIAYVDHAAGAFLDWLNQSGRLENSIVIVSADHGESFEHGWFKHRGPYLYNALIRIPLLIHLPGQKQGARILQPAEQVDLLPTILDLVGGSVPAWTEGTSLVPAFQSKPLPQRLLFSMNLETNSSFQPIRQGTVAVIDENFKYVEQLGTHEVSLYRYRTDPFEERNLLESEPAIAMRMKDLLADKLQEVNRQTMAAP